MELFTSPANNPLRDCGNFTGLFSNQNELAWHDIAHFRVMPTYQGLESNLNPIAIDFGLVVQAKLIFFDCCVDAVRNHDFALVRL